MQAKLVDFVYNNMSSSFILWNIIIIIANVLLILGCFYKNEINPETAVSANNGE